MALLALLNLAAQNAGTRAATAPAPNPSAAPAMANPPGVRPMPDNTLAAPATDVRSANAPPVDAGSPVASVMPAVPIEGKDDDQTGGGSTSGSPPSPLTGIADLTQRSMAFRQQAQGLRSDAASKPAVTPRRMTGLEAGIAGLLSLLAPDAGQAAVHGFQQGAGQEAANKDAQRTQQMQQAEVQAQGLEGQANRLDVLANRGIEEAHAQRDADNRRKLALIQTSGKSMDELIKTLHDKDANPVDKASAMETLRSYDSDHYRYSDADIDAVRSSPWIYGQKGGSIVDKNEGAANKSNAQADYTAGALTDRTNAQATADKARADYLHTRADDIKKTYVPRVQAMYATAGLKKAQADFQSAKAVDEHWRAEVDKKNYQWYDRKAGAAIQAAGDKALAALNTSNASVARVIAQQQKVGKGGAAGQVTAKDLFNANRHLDDALDKSDAYLARLQTDDANLNERLDAIKAGRAQNVRGLQGEEQQDIENKLKNNAALEAHFHVLADRATARKGALQKASVAPVKTAKGSFDKEAIRRDGLAQIQANPKAAAAIRAKFQGAFGEPLGG